MAGTSTILIAREDLSIPGTDEDKERTSEEKVRIERVFFDLLRENRPDVVVLDLSKTQGCAIDGILKIRERCGVPILVVCAATDQAVADYRLAGAAECLFAPIDIMSLNNTIQRIIRVTGRATRDVLPRAEIFAFAGMTYRPDQNVLCGPNGSSIKLTTSENDLLSYFLGRARLVCKRDEIVATLYGRHRPTSDRAIDVVVNRLRKKLVSARGPAAENLVKTEFRRGYMLVADVSTVSHIDAPLAGAL